MYDQVKENIRKLRQAGVDVSLNVSITPYNRNDLEQIYIDAEELDVNVKCSSYMYPPIRLNGGDYGVGNRLSAEESAAYSVEWDCLRFMPDEFEYRAKNMANLINTEPEGCLVEEGEGIRCRAGSTSFWMTWDGRMMPCGMMTSPVVYPLEVGFDAAWEQLRQYTAQIRMPGKCVTCDYREICNVCAAVCLAETGHFEGVPEYVCRRSKEIVRQTQLAWEKRNKI